MGKRTIKWDTLRALLARSGNRCAFPGCEHPIFNNDNLFIAQLCHIEAVSVGGPRYNSTQTDKQRNAYSNLLFLCYRHHKESDNYQKYTVQVLRNIKEIHESKHLEAPFNFNATMLIQIKEDMKEYWNDIQRVNSEDISGLRMEIDTQASFVELIDEVYDNLEIVFEALEGIAKDDKDLYKNTKEFLEGLGYDVRKLDEVEYYKNPLINRNWELHNLGWPNWINKLRFRLAQIEIRYFEEYLTINPNDIKATERIEIIKNELKSMSASLGYVD